MMEMIQFGKKVDDEQYNDRHRRNHRDSKEHVALLGESDRPLLSSRLNNRNRLKTRDDEERVSLLNISGDALKSGGGGGRRAHNKLFSGDKRKRSSKYNKSHINRNIFSPLRSLSRVMKYIAILFISAMCSFLLLRKQSKMIHWEEYHKILEPEESKDEPRCFEKSRSTIDERCSCPDPNKAIGNETSKLWTSNHERIVYDAQNAPDDLDIVFFGDGMIEQLSGTRGLGEHIEEGMEMYFEKEFTKKHGGKIDAIALGSSGDTGPNLLWHWENGISQSKLNPKIWFIMVGGNDLFEKKCTDRFVMANILNVAKRIFEDRPESKIIVHGIKPRKDYQDTKSNELGHLWNRAQGVNLEVRKFIKKHSSRIYYFNLGQILLASRHMKGRSYLDPKLMSDDGINPNPDGMKKWADLLKKKITVILRGFDIEKHRHQQNKQGGNQHLERNSSGTKQI